MKVFLISLGCAMILSGCGVRGRPLPPLEPTPLGPGKPSFTRSSEGYGFRDSVSEPTGSPTPAPGGDQ